MFPDLLRQKVGFVGLSPAQIEALEGHYRLLQRWNKVLNLTTVDSLEEAVERHYGESFFLARHLPQEVVTIADIGSGAGFPGIPVAIFNPDWRVTLIESHQRKAVFLREATRGLGNVRVIARRAEEMEERFDCAISRAVSYEDLVPVLKKISKNADLLTGGEAPPVELGFEWEEPIPLPWGKSRFLRIGVSRGTPSVRFT